MGGKEGQTQIPSINVFTNVSKQNENEKKEGNYSLRIGRIFVSGLRI